ncbi:hypothetical protein ACXPWS_10065 [Mycobacterium sp. BMJ-28]
MISQLACSAKTYGATRQSAVEGRIRAYTSSRPALTDTLRIAAELRTRIDFLRLALAPMVRNGAYKDITGNESNVEKSG